jgi:transcriptional regulator with XRE-family HTH domain
VRLAGTLTRVPRATTAHRLGGDVESPVPVDPEDARSVDPVWDANPLFHAIRLSHLASCGFVRDVVSSADVDASTAGKAAPGSRRTRTTRSRPASGRLGDPRKGTRMTTDADDPQVRQLGQYIRLQRQMADLSLRGMAELTKVSNAYLSQVERGLHQPSLRVLQAIAEALKIPADTLLAQAGVVSSPKPSAEARASTEEAIRSDPGLTPEEREAMVRIYRSFVDGRSASA